MTANANQPASEAVSPAGKRRGPDLTEDPIGRLLIALAVPAGIGFFFMIVWLVPFGFFISIAANESVLPGGATVPGATANGGNLGGYDPNRGGGKKTRNALLMLLDTLKLYWTRITEKFLPKGGIPGTYRDPGHMKGW